MTGTETATVLGTKIRMMTAEHLIGLIVEAAQRQTKTVIDYANVQTLNLAYQDRWLQDFLNRASIVFCDGFGALLAARLLRHPVARIHRVTAPDHFDRLAVQLQQARLSLYLLGSKAGVVDEAINRLRSVAPALRVRGYHGYFEKTGPENDAVLRDINGFKPDVLYLGFGMPAQEQWIESNISCVDARVFLALGACLDFYTGGVRRGPKWMTDNGAEWLSRLLVEPRRLWKRYLIGNPIFFFRVFQQLLSDAGRRGGH